jgi:hypothetical protein
MGDDVPIDQQRPVLAAGAAEPLRSATGRMLPGFTYRMAIKAPSHVDVFRQFDAAACRRAVDIGLAPVLGRLARRRYRRSDGHGGERRRLFATLRAAHIDV